MSKWSWKKLRSFRNLVASVGAWKPRRNIALVVLAGNVFGLALQAVAIRAPSAQKIHQRDPPSPFRLRRIPAWRQSGSFSPDGSQFAFSWNGDKQDNKDIYVRMIGIRRSASG